MNSFISWTPTKVVFGEGTAKEIGKEVKAFGGTRALIIYGGGSVVKSGLLDTVKSSLDEQNITHYEVGGVQPNPLAEFAQDIVEEYKDKKIDFVLGIGGGSAIDTAKAVAHSLASPHKKVWDIFTQKETVDKSIPIGVVLTIAAAGSETSDSAVLTSTATGLKRGLGTQFNRPAFAIMDPVLTYTTPKRHTIAGVVDIMMHTLDRYFGVNLDNDVTDEISEAILRVTIENGRLVMKDPNSYKARSELFWAGSLSHVGITGLGQGTDMPAHQLGHSLSALYDVPHGESLSIVWAAWAKYVYKANVARFARYARKVWGITEADDDKAALAGIDATRNYFVELGAPISISEVKSDVSDSDIEALVDNCTFKGTRTFGVFRRLEANDMREIYKAVK